MTGKRAAVVVASEADVRCTNGGSPRSVSQHDLEIQAARSLVLLRKLYNAAKPPPDDSGVRGKDPHRRTCRVCASNAAAVSVVPHKKWCPIPEVAAFLTGVES